MNETKLTNHYTVADCKKALKSDDKEKIAELIYQRFQERFISPLDSIPKEKKHGFCIVAICCLLIESLWAFKQGDITTKDKAFKEYFLHSSRLSPLADDKLDFYHNIRCSILHQAETGGGWKIRRSGKLCDRTAKTINATKLLSSLKKELNDYREEIKKDIKTWENAKKKLMYICSISD
ncbi:hypothetical protein [Salidesulfovibrio onnuriiensis]|uniref:hypothetical protein n=1 Tax=Salidesulfovibrio onnuriiensis TaxID=2583823 RepID=UPI0011CAD991|nr:hypothetical protein [Salidesulfovibrio onnuriiensis]